MENVETKELERIVANMIDYARGRVVSGVSNGGKKLIAFLFESDLPWGLQVFWKCLNLFVAALLIYVGISTAALTAFETGVMCVLGACFVVLGLFTKLGATW